MENEYLAMNPMEALQIQPMNLQGGVGGAMDQGNPTMDAAKMLGTAYLQTQFGPMGAAAGKAAGGFFYGGTTSVPEPMGYMNGTTNVPYNYMNGTEEVPGQRTGQDTVPAMLSPGEAVIPASAAQDPANQGAIEGMVEEGRADQGMAGQILQSLGLPMDPQLVALIEDMLAQGIPPEVIVQQLQERMAQTQGGQEMPSEMPQEAPMAPMGAQQAPMETMEQDMGMPQGLYGGTSNVSSYSEPQYMYDGSINVQTPLSGDSRRKQQKFDSEERRSEAAFQADQSRKNETHKSSLDQKSESAMYARSMR